MDLILTVILIICMFLSLMAALPFPQVAPFGWMWRIFIWISVAILCFLVVGGGHVVVR